MIETAQPDVLITDIKMPFMDGLQLCRIVRERQPRLKVIILSGHDEFEYAQEAVKLGVTEYLLKPVGVRALQETLAKVAAQIEEERNEAASLVHLHEQLRENLSLLREKFVLQLLMGAVQAPDAIERSRELELDILAKRYLVLALRVELDAEQCDYGDYQEVKEIVAALVERNPDVFLAEKDMGELVLIVKGDSADYLEQAAYFLMQLIEGELEAKLACSLKTGIGQTQSRISDIHQSFAQALMAIESGGDDDGDLQGRTDKSELLKLDRTAVAEYLRFGVIDDYDEFSAAHIRPLGQAAQRSTVLKTVALVDVALATAKFVRELGGSIDKIVPQINRIDSLLLDIRTPDEFERQVREILFSALAFRDRQAHNPYGDVIRQAKAYIEGRFAEPELSLAEVAAHVNLSASHFQLGVQPRDGRDLQRVRDFAQDPAGQSIVAIDEPHLHRSLPSSRLQGFALLQPGLPATDWHDPRRIPPTVIRCLSVVHTLSVAYRPSHPRIIGASLR